MQSPDAIHIVIPVHNRVESTLKCLDSIARQSYPHVSVVVVDDGSTDSTAERVAQAHPGVTVLRGSGELFWTGAIRLGIGHVLQSARDGDWVLLVNNDAVLGDGVLFKLVAAGAATARRSIISAITLDLSDGNSVVTTGTRVRSWFLNSTHHVLSGSSYAAIASKERIAVDFLTGRCLLHPVEIFAEIGNYDEENFPHYAGDDEFTYRAKARGYQLLIDPDIVVYLDTSRKSVPPSFAGKLDYLLFRLFDKRSSVNLRDKAFVALKIVPWYAKPTYLMVGIMKSFATVLLDYKAAVGRRESGTPPA
jgi:GT2 family glycosyltransferase